MVESIFGSILVPKRGAKMYERWDLKRRRECVRTESENMWKLTQKWGPKTVAKDVFFWNPQFYWFLRDVISEMLTFRGPGHPKNRGKNDKKTYQNKTPEFCRKIPQTRPPRGSERGSKIDQNEGWKMKPKKVMKNNRIWDFRRPCTWEVRGLGRG